MIAGNCLGINAALKFLNGLHHLTLCVYFSFHRRKSNDFCLIQICPTNWEGYIIAYIVKIISVKEFCNKTQADRLSFIAAFHLTMAAQEYLLLPSESQD